MKFVHICIDGILIIFIENQVLKKIQIIKEVYFILHTEDFQKKAIKEVLKDEYSIKDLSKYEDQYSEIEDLLSPFIKHLDTPNTALEPEIIIDKLNDFIKNKRSEI